jgi:hypothetical protein
MRGVPIDGAFDDYHGELVGIGRDPEQASLPRPGPRTARPPRSGNRQRVPAVTSPALAQCAAFTRQVVEPFSEDTPGTDVAGQDVQRGPSPVVWALATDSPSSCVARFGMTVAAGSALVGVGFVCFDFLAITSSDCASSLPSLSPKAARPSRIRMSDLRREYALLQDTDRAPIGGSRALSSLSHRAGTQSGRGSERASSSPSADVGKAATEEVRVGRAFDQRARLVGC